MAATMNETVDYPDPDPAGLSSENRRPWILFNTCLYMGNRPNHTTAEAFTRYGEAIEVSMWPDDPPAPSRLFLHCPDVDLREVPRILCAGGDFLLIRLCYVTPRDKGDYFLYRAGGGSPPMLKRLPKPRVFGDTEVGLLPRGDHVTVAALSLTLCRSRSTRPRCVYGLQVLDSESCDWTFFDEVPVTAPQRPFPIQIPDNASRLYKHYTTTVITLGGEGGTMGWADLFRGILFCDVLRRDSPTLRGVPVPLPMPLVKDGAGIEGCADMQRGIAVNAQGHLRIVEMYVHSNFDIARDDKTGYLNFNVHDWELFTYTNTKLTGAWEDWQLEHKVRASTMEVDQAMQLQLLHTGLLPHGKIKQREGLPQKLQNIHTSQPALGLDDDEGTVYLLTRLQFRHPKERVLAVDMKHNRIRAVAQFGSSRCLGLPPAYCPSRISSYMNASTTAPATNGNLRCLTNQYHQVDNVIQAQGDTSPPKKVQGEDGRLKV